MKENVYQHNLRLNLDIPEHMRVHQLLLNTDTNRFKSKNAYMVDVILAGAEKMEQEALDSTSLFLNERQMQELENRITEQIKKDIFGDVLKTLLGMAVTNSGAAVELPTEDAAYQEDVDDELADLALDYFEE